MQNRVVLWCATVVALLLLSTPHVAHSQQVVESATSVYQKYYAMMETRNQLASIYRSEALALDSTTAAEIVELKTAIIHKYQKLKSGFLKSGGANSFKSCSDINSNRLRIYGKSSIEDGIYLIVVNNQTHAVYCDMNTMGGGFTLVRRVSTTGKWWPLNDKFAGLGYGIYDPTLAFANEVVFGLDYRSIPRSRVLITTGDKTRWVLVDQKSLTDGYSGGNCDTSAQLIASSISNEPVKVKWCKRTGVLEDPWVSINDHFYKDYNVKNESEEHSMLWGENSIHVWSLWKDNHNGINVFIR